MDKTSSVDVDDRLAQLESICRSPRTQSGRTDKVEPLSSIAMPTPKSLSATFLVVDVMPAPHGGRILRLSLESGQAPSIKDLKGARLRAVSPDGAAERMLRVEGFAVFGGKPSDRRLSRTGRVDIHVTEESGDGPGISLGWAVSRQPRS